MKFFFFPLIAACLVCVSFSVEPTQNQDELKRISMMIVQGKSGTDIMNAWKALVTKNPKIDVDNSINTIVSTAKNEAESRREAARKKNKFYKTLNEQIESEIKLIRPYLQKGETDFKPIPRKSFSLNPDANGRVIVSQNGTVPDPRTLSEYNKQLEQQKASVLKNIQASESELATLTQSYNNAVALIAGIQKQMHDDAMKILDNLKG